MTIDIVTQNIELMRSARPGGMQYEASQQGFTGEYKGLQSTVVDYFYDDKGRMMHFSHNKSPLSMREFNRHFVQIAMQNANVPGKRTRIVGFTPPAEASDTAKHILEKTIKAYNAQYSFQPNPSV